MSFPFGSRQPSLRQRMLIAISSGTLLGLGAAGLQACGSQPDDPSEVCPNGDGTRTCHTRAEMESSVLGSCHGNSVVPAPQLTAEQIKAAFLPNGCLPKSMVCDGCCQPAPEEGVPQDDGSCCYAHCRAGACCGRPFTVDGHGRLAGVIDRSDWLAASPAESVPLPAPALARRIADEWLADARMEHASIASFARFSLELLHFGAPAVLLEQAQRAALDEVEHARVCFSLASRFAGQSFGPSRLRIDDAPPARTLADAAARAFQEGCVGETIAAAHARAALERARDPEVCRALAKIADDEARHAELAWSFVAWAIARNEPGVTDALERACARAAWLQSPAGESSEPPAALAALHAAGRLSAAERAEYTAAALSGVILPCAGALLAQAGRQLALGDGFSA